MRKLTFFIVMLTFALPSAYASSSAAKAASDKKQAAQQSLKGASAFDKSRADKMAGTASSSSSSSSASSSAAAQVAGAALKINVHNSFQEEMDEAEYQSLVMEKKRLEEELTSVNNKIERNGYYIRAQVRDKASYLSESDKLDQIERDIFSVRQRSVVTDSQITVKLVTMDGKKHDISVRFSDSALILFERAQDKCGCRPRDINLRINGQCIFNGQPKKTIRDLKLYQNEVTIISRGREKDIL